METKFETVAKFFPLPIPHYIAKCIKDALNLPSNDPDTQILGVRKVTYDLNPDGSYKSDKKTLEVLDRNGYVYEVTIKTIGKDTI